MAQAPSLAQARLQSNKDDNDDSQKRTHHHRHLHSHLRPRHMHSGKQNKPHIRLDEQQQQAPKRDLAEQDRRLTEVVQTVSVVQVVNESGVAVKTRTYFPDTVSSIVPPAETAPPSALELTAGLSSNVESSSLTSAAASSPGDDAHPTATTSDLLLSASSLLSTVSSISASGTVTSAPSSTITSFPTLSGLYNSTSEYRSRAPCSLLVPIGTECHDVSC